MDAELSMTIATCLLPCSTRDGRLREGRQGEQGEDRRIAADRASR
jgi:hypothetical protein